MGDYQHWLPKAYLRGFLMSKPWYRRLKASNRGLSTESLFIARLPDLTHPEECQGFELVWDWVNLSEIGGSDSLHADKEADRQADADLGDFGRVMGELRAETRRLANGPCTVPEFGGPDDEELPNPVHPLLSVVKDPQDAALLLRTIAIGKFRGPYADNLRVRQLFEHVLAGKITGEDVKRVVPEGDPLRSDLDILLQMRRKIAKPWANPRLLGAALSRTLELGRGYLPDHLAARDGHSLLPEDEEGLASVLGLPYGGLDDMYLLDNGVSWTCDAPFFSIAPEFSAPVGGANTTVRFNVGVQLSGGVFLTSSKAATRDPGAFFATGRANPLFGLAQWLIAPEPPEEVCLMASSRPWERPLKRRNSIGAMMESVYGEGLVLVRLGRATHEPQHWSPVP